MYPSSHLQYVPSHLPLFWYKTVLVLPPHYHASITQLLAISSSGSGAPESPTVCQPTGLTGLRNTALKNKNKKNRDCILAREYIDFVELPPAKGKPPPVTPHTRRKHHLVNVFDLLQQKELIPDLGTWVQCLAIYAVIYTYQVALLTSLVICTR